MTKHKIKHIRIELENGVVIEHDGGMFSSSFNSRKASGFKNSQEWMEFHATWITVPEKPTPLPVEKKPLQGVVVRAEDYLDDPTFCGIEHGVPKFRQQRTQYDFDDFGFEIGEHFNGSR